MNKVLLVILIVLGLSLNVNTSFAKQLPNVYTGDVIEVIDSDTFKAKLYIWVGMTITTTIKIGGIDTPSIHGKCSYEKVAGTEAMNRLKNLLPVGSKILVGGIEQYKGASDNVSAVLVRNQKEVDLADQLIHDNLAVPYTGNHTLNWCGDE